jgi:RNA polymerase sigma-70 factor (ECF subfamily)
MTQTRTARRAPLPSRSWPRSKAAIRTFPVNIFEHFSFGLRLVDMSTSQAIYAGWMELLNSATDGDARTEAGEAALDATLAALVDQYSGTLYRVAYSVLRNPSDAEDAVQEAFMRVLRHRDTLHEVRDCRVWLIRIVWNVVLDRKRRAKTRPETDDVAELAWVLPAEGLSAEERVSAAQHHAHVLRCVEKLPTKEREVLLLSAFEELTSVEIAGVLGITESSVRSRLFRARNLMADLLSHERGLR